MPQRPELSHEVAGSDRMVLALRKDHPAARGRFTVARLAATVHVTVSRGGRLTGPMDDALAVHGLRRTVVASLPSSAAALEVVSRSDAVVVVAERACRPALRRLGLSPGRCRWTCRPSRSSSPGTTATTATPRTPGCAARSAQPCMR